MALSDAERQANRVTRMLTAGLKLVRNLWAHPDDVSSIRDHAAKLARRRERTNQQKETR